MDHLDPLVLTNQIHLNQITPKNRLHLHLFTIPHFQPHYLQFDHQFLLEFLSMAPRSMNPRSMIPQSMVLQSMDFHPKALQSMVIQLLAPLVD